jgi:hypothetical protein
MQEKLLHKDAIMKIRNAHRKRAEYIYFIFKEIETEFGKTRAEKITRRALREAGKYYGKKMNETKNPSQFVGRIERDSHEDIFQRTVLKKERDSSIFQVKHCPLVDAWKDLGLSKEDVSLLCEIAMETDFGIIEKLGFNMKLVKSIGCGDECCEMRITKFESG